MTNNKYSALINSLLSSTKENRINWQKTSRQNEYSIDVLNYSVTITCLSQGTFSILNSQNEKYALTLFNEDGELIDIIEIMSNDADYKSMSSLYSEARRSYYKVDDVLKTIIDNI